MKGKRINLLLLLLFCGIHNVKGEDAPQTDPDPENGGAAPSPFQNRFAEMLIWSKPVSKASTMFVNENQRKVLAEVAEDISKEEFFWGLNQKHMKAVSKINDVLMEQESPDDWLEMASGFREQVNPHVWLRAVYSSAIRRKDLQSLRLAPLVEVVPSMLVNNKVLEDLRQTVNVPPFNRSCVPADGSMGIDNGPENALWYFREDIMVNSQHWFWHISYPLGGDRNRMPDRNGELFYFLHHDFLARYHNERLSAGLPPMKEYVMEEGSLIPNGYSPHLNEGNSGFDWSTRPPNTPLRDIPEDNLFGAPAIHIKTRTLQKNRILASIANGSLIASNGKLIPLDSKKGITYLGNVVQANIYSINPNYYGFNGMHNNGHIVISLVLDPDFRKGIPPGVMGDTATAMRDPIFPPYHLEIDAVFQSHKNKLAPYQLREGDWPLLLEGVTLKSLQVQSKNCPVNELHTFFNSKRFDLSRGLDFARDQDNGPLYICAKMLDHKQFQYELEIEQAPSSPTPKEVTVRLFMGPKHDLYGRRYSLEEERSMIFILDTFQVQLHEGLNKIRRNSTETPLTIDFNQSLNELDNSDWDLRPFCGCGWPHHMLLPKGNKRGLSFHIFAIVTNAEEDKVEQAVGDDGEEDQCQTAYIYCGLMGKKYPDGRPMGYPFDRKSFIAQNHYDDATLEQLADAIPNAAVAQVKIMHVDQKYGING